MEQAARVLLLLLVLASCAPGQITTSGGRESAVPASNNTLNLTLSELTQVPGSWNDSYTVVDLSRNSISLLEPLPSSPSISRLLLRHNNISELADKAFAGLTGLRELDLSFNYLTATAVTPQALRGKGSILDYEPLPLEVIFLSNNELHALDDKVFEHLPNLTALYLDHNPLLSLDPVTVLAITNAHRRLEVLDLSYCGLEVLPEGFLHTLAVLDSLNLAGNQFVSAPAALEEASGSLRWLSLSDNPLTELTLPPLERLEELEVCYTDTLESLQDGSLAELPALRVLRCCHNPELATIQQGVFGNTTSSGSNLTLLDLRGNGLRTLPELTGVIWDQATLDLRENPWSCDCNLAWMADTVLARLQSEQPLQAKAIKCASPATVAGVPLTRLPLRACREAVSATRRVTALLGFLAVLTVAGTVLMAGQWSRRWRHPPLPPRIPLHEMEQGEDVVHYVRIFNSRDE